MQRWKGEEGGLMWGEVSDPLIFHLMISVVVFDFLLFCSFSFRKDFWDVEVFKARG